jgi:rhodanese-related sulfurtransferase
MDETQLPIIDRDALVRLRQSGTPLILIDVLSHESYLRAHIPGSINVPLQVVRQLVPVLVSRHERIVIYCANFACSASATAVRILQQLDYTQVWDYAGGIEDWHDGDLPLVWDGGEAQAA